MIVRLASGDIEEVRRALSSAHREVIRELAQSSGLGADPTAIELCRRKWKLEAVLRQLDSPERPPAALQIVPLRKPATLERVAA